MSSMPNFALNT